MNFITQGVRVCSWPWVQADITQMKWLTSPNYGLTESVNKSPVHYEHWREASGTMCGWHDGSAYADDVSFRTFASDRDFDYQTRQLGDLILFPPCCRLLVDKLTEFSSKKLG